MNKIKTSIIIPVKNGAKTLDACLNAIFKQTLIHQTEVIIIDSGSTDGSLDIIKKYPVRLYQIKPEDFGHGKTRNYGVSLARGEFVVMTVQDARPATNNWLELLLSNFNDKNTVAVCGQQAVPHEKDKNPVQWHRPYSTPKPRTIHFEKGEFEKLSPQEQKQACSWDDVNAMYRKSILKKIPFEDVAFGEDMLWVKKALTSAYQIAYDMRARVWHYHHYRNMKKLRERVYNQLYFTYKFFNYLPENPYNLIYFLRLLYILIKFKIALKWWYYNLKISIVMRNEHKKFLNNNLNL